MKQSKFDYEKMMNGRVKNILRCLNEPNIESALRKYSKEELMRMPNFGNKVYEWMLKQVVNKDLSFQMYHAHYFSELDCTIIFRKNSLKDGHYEKEIVGVYFGKPDDEKTAKNIGNTILGY